jgi:hypothetical protein
MSKHRQHADTEWEMDGLLGDDSWRIPKRKPRKMPKKFKCGICETPVTNGRGAYSGVLGYDWCCEQCAEAVLRPAKEPWNELVRAMQHPPCSFRVVWDTFREKLATLISTRRKAVTQ